MFLYTTCFNQCISHQDVDAVIKLKEKYPDRILMTRFETIATHPIISTKNIYDFIGLEFTKSIAMFVYKKTHSKTAGRGYSTDRADSLGEWVVIMR